MVGHNNMIPYGHFHKKWQTRIKMWFNQPMKKLRRRTQRLRKFAQMAPKPISLLRPIVHPPSMRYNNKIRAGRGFTQQELKLAGINKKFARSLGIVVDHRRKNRSYESLSQNAQRLKEYKQRLILFPQKSKAVAKFDRGETLNEIKNAAAKLKVRKVSDEEKKFEAFANLRRARNDAKFAGVRMKRKLKKDGADPNKFN